MTPKLKSEKEEHGIFSLKSISVTSAAIVLVCTFALHLVSGPYVQQVSSPPPGIPFPGPSPPPLLWAPSRILSQLQSLPVCQQVQGRTNLRALVPPFWCFELGTLSAGNSKPEAVCAASYVVLTSGKIALCENSGAGCVTGLQQRCSLPSSSLPPTLLLLPSLPPSVPVQSLPICMQARQRTNLRALVPPRWCLGLGTTPTGNSKRTPVCAASYVVLASGEIALCENSGAGCVTGRQQSCSLPSSSLPPTLLLLPSLPPSVPVQSLPICMQARQRTNLRALVPPRWCLGLGTTPTGNSKRTPVCAASYVVLASGEIALCENSGAGCVTGLQQRCPLVP